jgi:hypothetical protein
MTKATLTKQVEVICRAHPDHPNVVRQEPHYVHLSKSKGDTIFWRAEDRAVTIRLGKNEDHPFAHAGVLIELDPNQETDVIGIKPDAAIGHHADVEIGP